MIDIGFMVYKIVGNAGQDKKMFSMQITPLAVQITPLAFLAMLEIKNDLEQQLLLLGNQNQELQEKLDKSNGLIKVLQDKEEQKFFDDNIFLFEEEKRRHLLTKVALQDKIRSLEKQIEDLRNHHATQIEDLRNYHNMVQVAQEKSFQEHIEAFKQEIDSLLSTNEILQVSVATLQEKEKFLGNKLLDEQNKQTMLSTANNKLTEDIIDLQKKNEALKEENESLKKQNENLTRLYGMAHDQSLKAQNCAIQQVHRMQTQAHHDRLEAKQWVEEQLASQKPLAETEIERLKNKLFYETQEVDGLKKKHEELAKKHKTLRASYKNLEKDNLCLKNKLDGLLQDNSLLKTKLDAVQDKFDKLQTNFMETRTKRDAWEKKWCKLTGKPYQKPDYGDSSAQDGNNTGDEHDPRNLPDSDSDSEIE